MAEGGAEKHPIIVGTSVLMLATFAACNVAPGVMGKAAESYIDKTESQAISNEASPIPESSLNTAVAIEGDNLTEMFRRAWNIDAEINDPLSNFEDFGLIWTNKDGQAVAWFQDKLSFINASAIPGLLPDVQPGDSIASGTRAATEAEALGLALHLDKDVLKLESWAMELDGGVRRDVMTINGGDFASDYTVTFTLDHDGNGIWMVQPGGGQPMSASEYLASQTSDN